VFSVDNGKKHREIMRLAPVQVGGPTCMRLVAILDKKQPVNKRRFIHNRCLWISIDLSTGRQGDKMDLLKRITVPVIQGPMAGGASGPALAAAVSNGGGLGSMACSLLSPYLMHAHVERLRELTDRPFMLNLFVQETPTPSAAEVDQAVELLRPVWEGLGWTELPRPAAWCEDFNVQFDTLLLLKPAAASFTFGILTAGHVERLHAAGIEVVGTITTVAEGLAWQAIGADAVVASGIECGGHRGTFLGPQEEADLPGKVLWPAAAKALSIPVIAAGGIMTGNDIRAALDLGARAVQMGTAFLVCDEAGIHPAYREALLNAGNSPVRPTRLTRAFSGRYARGLVNDFMEKMRPVELSVPAYPVQNALTGSIRAAAAKSGDTELMSLWAGTGVARARALPATQLMHILAAELRAA
jgi:nitronate monooxygenase